MSCPSCSAENRAEARFCARCGSPLSASCPLCGTPCRDGDRFCTQCGQTLAGPRPSAPAGALAGRSGVEPSDGLHGAAEAGAASEAPPAERRLVSVLFVDLVGFTPFSEVRDHEEVREVLSRYFARSRAIVERHGGVVEKFIGDAILAIWGVPAIHEDDAERAVRAALEVVESVAELGASLGTELAARAGVLTGEAAITNGAAFEEGRIAGDLVNTASRLQTSADPGTVLAGEATYHAARHAVAFAALGELQLKGKEEPVRAFRALRVVAQRRGVGRSEGLEPPFVGRAEELRALKDALDAVGRERRPRLVSVTGAPGIGKSRLAWEFLKYVDGLAEGVYWHQGRSPSYGEGITFWALGEMVRMRAGISEGEDPASAREKLAATLARFVADEGERRVVGAPLGHLLGLAEAPPVGRDELFAAWRRFFELIADDDPVVMVFEDLQWADPGMVDFVESILEWSRRSPILVVTLARPELLERRPSWGAGQRNFTAIELGPLGAPAMRELLKGLVHELPEAATEQILARAEGVPLYAVETVRMLLDKGVLAGSDGAYELCGEWAELQVPDSLRALIASRLDALPAGEQSLVRDAAVLGQSFTAAGLAALAGAAGEEGAVPAGIGPLLRSLVRKELLILDTDPRSPGRGQYGFVQSLLREVAYSMLSRRDRLAKHLAAAAHFESLAEEELVGAVATHYLAAREAALEAPERDALGARALDWLERAGQRAVALGSPAQALTYFEEALALVPGGPARLALLERAGEAADRAAAGERAEALLGEAIAGYEQAGDPRGAGRALALLAPMLGDFDRHSEAIARLGVAIAALAELTDPEAMRVRGRLSCDLAMALVLSGETAAGLVRCEEALALAEQVGDEALLLRALGRKGVALSRVGRRREASMLTGVCVGLAGQQGEAVQLAVNLLNGAILAWADDPRRALRDTLDAVQVARSAGMAPTELLGLMNAAEFAVFLGDVTEARRLLAAAAEAPAQRGSISEMGFALAEAELAALVSDATGAVEVIESLAGQMARAETADARSSVRSASVFARLLAGDAAGAQHEALAAVAEEPHNYNTLMALVLACHAALQRRDRDGAQAIGEQLHTWPGRWAAAARSVAGAGVAALEGRLGEARAGFSAAAEQLRRLDCPLDLAFCLLDEVLLLGVADAGDEVVAELAALAGSIGSPALTRSVAAATGAATSVP